MLTWMLYVVVITLLLSGAALAAEHAARLRRARNRWIWAAAIVASLIIPTLIASVSIQVPNLQTPTGPRKVTTLRELTSVQVVPLNWVHEHTGNIVATHRENRVLQGTWIAVSVTLLAALVLNGLHLVWRRRRWRVGMVAGVSVYFAPDAGPAVVGLVRPRIVIPEWLAEASPSRQAMVLAHEQSHVASHDPQLLTVALFLLVLMPWNLPLWWQLHRLRRAIEVDCDARVLRGGVDSCQYGETLIDVSQRPSAYVGSVAAMSESGSFLEERISIMVNNPAKWSSLAALMFGSLALSLVAVAAQVIPPNFGASDSERQPAILTPAELDEYVGFYVRGANSIYEITRDSAGLHVQLSGMKRIELVADSNEEFVMGELGVQGPRVTFVRDAHGQITGLIEHYGTAFSVPLKRMDASAAQAIIASNDLKAHTQNPTPGSEAALRRLFDGVRTREPNYDEMAPWLAQLFKQVTAFNEVYVRRGAVQSIKFIHVDQYGGDTYEVRQEGGISMWTVWVDSNGLIQDADNYPN